MMLKRNGLNQVTIANIPLFGGWLPFIGFRDYPVDTNGKPIICDRELQRVRQPITKHVFFVLEWLIFFIALHVDEQEDCIY